MNRRGFTLVELAICLSITTLLMPLIYRYAIAIEDRSVLGLWHLETADGVRTVAEEIRLDAGRSSTVEGTDLRFRTAACEVQYTLSESQVLVREATAECGGTRALARDVEALTRTAGGVDITFARIMRADRTHRITVFIPVELR